MNDSISIRVVCRLYATMLHGYPREFRLRYGVEMQQFFRDRCRELLCAHAGSGVWLRFGLRTAADWIASTVRERRAHKLVQEWAVTILLFLFVTTTMVQAYVVPTGSMEGNILVGDHMLVDKVGFENGGSNWSSYVLPHRDVKRGDIIAFRYPENIRQTFVKRVIGLPGDRIRMENKQVIRNGQKLDEPYARYSTSSIDDYRDNFPRLRISIRWAADARCLPTTCKAERWSCQRTRYLSWATIATIRSIAVIGGSCPATI
jgi:signal peptidase I